MKRSLRIVTGLILVFLATSLLVREDGELVAPLFLSVAAVYLLHRELVGFAILFWQSLCLLGKRLWGRAKEVEEMRYCKCCGKLAIYVVITCVPRPSAVDAPERRRLYVCRDHHPNPNIGESAEELRVYIKNNVHPSATDECVYPHSPF